MDSETYCGNCQFHGFPCLNCAYRFSDAENSTYAKGPGFRYNKRLILAYEMGEQTKKRLIAFCEKNKEEYRIFASRKEFEAYTGDFIKKEVSEILQTKNVDIFYD